MWGKGIYPPFDVIMSLSRLAKDAIGEGKTREDHKDVANTLISAYSKALELRSLATLVGERNLGWRERRPPSCRTPQSERSKDLSSLLKRREASPTAR
jgi:V/A-type H+-transporting ATPase subunit B